jgi:hypothetical protein
MQDAIDADRRDGGALQGRQENTPEGIAESQAKSTFQRLGYDCRDSLRVSARHDLQFGRFNESLPILLNHGWTFHRT